MFKSDNSENMRSDVTGVGKGWLDMIVMGR
jgi:hypothetical protein